MHLPLKEPTIHPAYDGVDHINVYSSGHTKLGKWLSNFTYSPFTHPEHGTFNSVEGFWYWVKSGMIHDELRELHGYKAKQKGKEFDIVQIDNFKEIIKEGLLCKFEQHPEMSELLKESILPLTHYYYFGTISKPKIVTPKDTEWLIDIIERYRYSLQK